MLLFALLVAATHASSLTFTKSVYYNTTTSLNSTSSTFQRITSTRSSDLTTDLPTEPYDSSTSGSLWPTSAPANATKGAPITRPTSKQPNKIVSLPHLIHTIPVEQVPKFSTKPTLATTDNNPIISGPPPTNKIHTVEDVPKFSTKPTSTATTLESGPPPTPKIPAVAEPDTGSTLGSGNFLQTTTVTVVSVSVEPASVQLASVQQATIQPVATRPASGPPISAEEDNAEQASGPPVPTTAFRLGSQTLSLGAQITYSGETYSLASNGVFIVGTQILNPGAQITDSGTTYSRASNGASLVIGGTNTQILVSSPPTLFILGTQTLHPGQQITYNGESYSLASNGGLIVGTQTLNPGQVITDSGTTYSRASNGGTIVVDGTSTEILASPTFSVFGGSNGGGYGGGSTSEPSSSPTHKNAGSATRGEISVWVIGSVFLGSILFVLGL